MAKSRYPNGLDTPNLTATTATVGALTADSIALGSLVPVGSAKAISVNCTNSYALSTAEKLATYIAITAAGTSKVLTLGMTSGQTVIVTNGGANNVTLKNASANTGVTLTAGKTSLIIVTAGEPIRVVQTS